MSATADGELVPVDPFDAVRFAMDRYWLVAVWDAHICEQLHAFVDALIERPDVRHRRRL